MSSSSTFQKEEGQKLLSVEGENESEDDEVVFTSAPIPSSSQPPPPPQQQQPPPLYDNRPGGPPTPAATLTPTPFTGPPSTVQLPPRCGAETHPFSPSSMPAAAAPVPINEAPPDYFLHVPKHPPSAKAGLAVQIQMDGRLVPGTVMEDASGRHMVYICQPAEEQPATLNAPGERPAKPNDYFLLSLLSLLCCCAPLGIVALFKSLEVQRLYRRGDYSGAARASRQAHSWASAAVVFGATIAVMVFALKIYFSEFERKQYYYYQ